jgi:Uri superfamily endonuclease
MDLNKSELTWGNLPKRQTGTYQLLIYLSKSTFIKIGKKGKFRFPKGYYVYTGSAKNGLKARIDRHLRKEKRLFWHIDYLLEHTSIKQVLLFPDGRTDECSLSKKTLKRERAEVIVPKFGASDCNCQTHLIFFERLKDIPLKRKNRFLFLQ